MRYALQSPAVSIFGTYTHAGFSYGARDGHSAAQILAQEVAAANDTAKRVIELAKELQVSASKFDRDGLRLAVGATPTAHAVYGEWEVARQQAGIGQDQLVGRVEL